MTLKYKQKNTRFIIPKKGYPMKTKNSIRHLGLVIFILIFITNGFANSNDCLTDLYIEKKIDSLLLKMTLEEKVAQMVFVYYQDNFFWVSPKENVANKHNVAEGLGIVGIALNGEEPKVYANAINSFQDSLLQKSQHGIPALVYGEGLHGFWAKDATSFPQAIAASCSWNPELVQQCYDATGREMRARGVTHAFAPNVDLGREPRWGRIDETFGEDPYLVGKMAVAAVKGLQGTNDEYLDENHVVATLKHFIAYSIPESGINTGPTMITERECRETFLLPYEMAINEAGAATVMSTYNDIDGIPMTASEKYMNRILKGELRFNGFILSDYGAVGMQITRHMIAENEAEAARMSIEAGLDVDLISQLLCYPELVELVRKSDVKEALIDEAVRRVLRIKFKMGLFNNYKADIKKIEMVNHIKKHQDLALKAAHESMVLLKNDSGFLPLNEEKISKLAIIGPNAKGIHLGSYSYEPRQGISVLEGIQNFAKGKFDVLYAKGCEYTQTDGEFFGDYDASPGDPAENKKLISQAVAVANEADILLVVVGGNETTARESWGNPDENTHLGDRDDLDLMKPQKELISALESTGKPMVVLLINGRPLSVPELKYSKQVKALIEGWYLGEKTGAAVADVIFGKVNPSGKLSVTIPKSVGQLPVYYYYKPSKRFDYIFSDAEPLYPFGYGLSYTSYKYSEPVLSNKEISTKEKTTVSVNVTNTGKVEGKEVVQLYIRDEFSSVVRPVKQLKGFEKINLKPGETKTVKFEIGTKELEFYNADMERVVEPGAFKIMTGPNSIDLKEAILTVKND